MDKDLMMRAAKDLSDRMGIPSLNDAVWFDPTEENLEMELDADRFERQLETNPEAGSW